MTYNAELFDRAAAQYDESPPFFRILGARLVDFANLPVASSVLDIGAGKGAVTLPALAAVGPSGTVTALEVAGQMVEFLETYSLPNLSVIHQDITKSTLPDASVDHAVSGFTLHILSDLRGALIQIHRILRGYGTLSWSKPGAHPEAIEWEESYGNIFGEFSKRLKDVPSEMTDEPDYESTFRAEGFEIIEQFTVPLRIPVGGPEEYWAWTQTHGARWLTDQLNTSDADEFKSAVIESLWSSHPTHGNDIMVAPLFTKMRRI
jgi:ubiquinone/menaquinone biosynthesis C-methylase UbiE